MQAVENGKANLSNNQTNTIAQLVKPTLFLGLPNCLGSSRFTLIAFSQFPNVAK